MVCVVCLQCEHYDVGRLCSVAPERTVRVLGGLPRASSAVPVACPQWCMLGMAHFQLRTCVVYGTMGASHYDNQIMVHVISVEMHAHTT